MKRQLFFISVLSISLGGCSTYFSKTNIDNSQQGNYYSGTKLNISEWKCYSKRIQKDPGFLILAPIVVPIMILDLPFSIIGDTAYIPIDAATTATHPPIVVSEECNGTQY